MPLTGYTGKKGAHLYKIPKRPLKPLRTFLGCGWNYMVVFVRLSPEACGQGIGRGGRMPVLWEERLGSFGTS